MSEEDKFYRTQEDPYKALENILMSKKAKVIFIDRTGVSENENQEIILMQNVPKEIYASSYPFRVL